MNVPDIKFAAFASSKYLGNLKTFGKIDLSLFDATISWKDVNQFKKDGLFLRADAIYGH